MKKRTSRTQDGAKAAKDNPGSATRSPYKVYPPEFRLKAVKLHLEEQMSYSAIEAATGVSRDSVCVWTQRYRQFGEAGLQTQSRVPSRGRKQVAAPVKAQIVELKKENPDLGVKSIAQRLKRFFFMQASPETVRETLKAENLQPSAPPPKPPPDPPQPRKFERSTPNQMWQSDISTFRLGGKVIYVIGFLDDYSRFITGLEIFHSQSAENVMEVFRRACADYGPPKEMLTDNGRQYAAWRGKTRFQQALAKAGIHHIRATPHHPMTLGKIERFWQTLKDDFLHRTQFATFEEGRERIRFWTKWYNHRRPNQGIDGLCPADRFFEIRGELRKVMEQGIQENQLELALRGQPQTPFYMVGKLDKQSVVMQTRGGKLVMTVSDENEKTGKEVVCDLEKGKVNYEQHEDKEIRTAADAAVHGDGEGSGGAADLDGEDDAEPVGQGDGADLDAADAVAGSGDGGDACRAGAEEPAVPEAVAAELAAAAAAGEEGGPAAGGPAAPEPEPGEAAGRPPAEGPGEGDGGGSLMAVTEAAGNGPPSPPATLAPAAAAPAPEGGSVGAGNGFPAAAGIPPVLLAAAIDQLLANGDLQRYLLSLAGNHQPAGITTNHGQQAHPVERGTAGESHAPGRPHHGGPRQDEVADRGGRGAGCLAQDLLRVGGARTDGNGRRPDGQGARPPHEAAAGPRADQAREAAPGEAEGDRAAAPDGAPPRYPRPAAATPAGTGPGASDGD